MTNPSDFFHQLGPSPFTDLPIISHSFLFIPRFHSTCHSETNRTQGPDYTRIRSAIELNPIQPTTSCPTTIHHCIFIPSFRKSGSDAILLCLLNIKTRMDTIIRHDSLLPPRELLKILLFIKRLNFILKHKSKTTSSSLNLNPIPIVSSAKSYKCNSNNMTESTDFWLERLWRLHTHQWAQSYLYSSTKTHLVYVPFETTPLLLRPTIKYRLLCKQVRPTHLPIRVQSQLNFQHSLKWMSVLARTKDLTTLLALYKRLDLRKVKWASSLGNGQVQVPLLLIRRPESKQMEQRQIFSSTFYPNYTVWLKVHHNLWLIPRDRTYPFLLSGSRDPYLSSTKQHLEGYNALPLITHSLRRQGL